MKIRKFCYMILLCFVALLFSGCDKPILIGEIEGTKNNKLAAGETYSARVTFKTDAPYSYYKIYMRVNGNIVNNPSCETYTSGTPIYYDFQAPSNVGDEIQLEIYAYANHNCQSTQTYNSISEKSSIYTVIKKSETAGPYKHGNITSVCAEDAYCKTLLDLAGKKAQSTSDNCHDTALGYIDAIANGQDKSYSSNNYIKIGKKLANSNGIVENISKKRLEILQDIKSEIDDGYPVLARVYRPTRNKSNTVHSVVVVGYNGEGTKMSDFLIIDPYSNVRSGSLVLCSLEIGKYQGEWPYEFCSLQQSKIDKSNCGGDYHYMMAISDNAKA